MRAGFGWTVAAWVLCSACGASDPEPAFGSGGTGSTSLAGGQAVSGAAGGGGRSTRGTTTRAGTGGRSGAAGISAGSAGVTGSAAGRSAVAGRTGSAGITAVAGRMGAAGTSTVGMAGTASVAGTGGSVSSATFAQVYAIFMNRCAGSTCHVGATGTGGDGLNMNDRMTAYRSLVGTTSASCRNEKRVVASNPDRSVLMHTIARTSLGSCTPPQMPLALPKLAQTEIDTVSAWIRGGAPNN